MTRDAARLYAIALAVVVFCVAWATIAAHPWVPRAAPAQDPRLAALAARQHRLQVESLRVKRVVDARWAAYRHALARHNAAQAKQAAQQAVQQAAVQASPTVRVVNLPPLVVTRTS